MATVWSSKATPEEIKNRKAKRVEIFKMPGGTEYIIHDIDENNHIVGRARFSGHVKVSESMSVDGFGNRAAPVNRPKGSNDDDSDDDYDDDDDDDEESVCDCLPPSWPIECIPSATTGTHSARKGVNFCLVHGGERPTNNHKHATVRFDHAGGAQVRVRV